MAIEQRITKRRAVKRASVASLTDFERADDEEVLLPLLFARASTAATVSPFALDFTRGEVIFVRTDFGVDLAEEDGRFVCAQRRHATHVIIASFEEAARTARMLGPSRMRLAWLYSTGQSGASLATRIARALPTVQSLDTSDLFSSAAVADREGRRPSEEIAQVLADCTRLLTAHREAVDPASPVLLVRLRSRATFAASLLARATPNARVLFLHRHPADVVDRYMGALFAGPIATATRALGVDRLLARALLAVLRHTHPHVPKLVPQVFEPVPRGERPYGVVELFALVLHAMRREVERLKDSRHVTVHRYEDLKGDTARFARRLARGLGVRIQDTDVLRAMRAAHEGGPHDSTRVESKRPSLSPADIARLESTFVRLEAPVGAV